MVIHVCDEAKNCEYLHIISSDYARDLLLWLMIVMQHWTILTLVICKQSTD